MKDLTEKGKRLVLISNRSMGRPAPAAKRIPADSGRALTVIERRRSREDAGDELPPAA